MNIMFDNCKKSPSLYAVLTFSLLATLLFGCDKEQTEFKSPSGYNLNRPYIIKLPSELDEISGISYYGKDNSLFAESDEKGCLYKILLNKPTDIRKWKFSHKRDYEDIVLHDSTFYVLSSNGDLVSLVFRKDSITTHQYTFPGIGKNEFESLYYDDSLRKFILVCKDCDIDQNNSVSTYLFDPVDSSFAGSYTIDAKSIVEQANPKSTKYKPSAAAINPATGELYILSSINKLLVVAKRDGTIKQLYHLDPSLFNQPEGITFSPNGNLFISNEAGNLKSATVLFYQFKKPPNE
jgi:uncharacterized protein YjiK